MPSAWHPKRSNQTIAWLALFVFVGAAVPTPSPAATQSPPPLPKRWIQFELMESETSGVVRLDKDLVLSITVGGIANTTDSILAIMESPAFYGQTVSLAQDGTPSTYQGTAILEPKFAAKSRTTVHPKATRVRVTLARAKPTGLEEFMKRDVYITLGEPALGETPDHVEEQQPSAAEEADQGESSRAEAHRPEPAVAANVTIAEEDLLPLPAPGEAEAYWKQVSGLISRNWSRQVRQIRRSPTGETVRVGFKLYSSGVAQLIQVEKTSGARDINEAGIQSIIHAHPFPPLPADLSGQLVDVHVRMRTGARVAEEDMQATIEKKASRKPPPSKSQPPNQ